MSDPVRLSRRVVELTGCSRAQAEQYIAGGWVSVDGRIVDAPQHKVTTESVVLDPDATLGEPEPATLLWHKPAGRAIADPATATTASITPAQRWTEDPSGIRLLHRHLQRLVALAPLEREASGLVVLSQDGRVIRRLSEDAGSIEHEYVVEVSGEIVPYGLARLNHGLEYRGRALPRCAVSWQNEIRLRFALKGAQPGQLADMCRQVGLQLVASRRIRIGRVSLGRMPPDQWRFLPADMRF